jgi:uncharacterized protein GlcG (DUF336 family)
MCHFSLFSQRTVGVLAVGMLAITACSDSTAPNPALGRSRLERLLPSSDELRNALRDIVKERNGGLGFDMWAAIVDRDGIVLEVVFSGDNRADQWPGSRVIAAQKANTANAFSLENFALSTANLYAPVQPGGSLFGLQESNPVDPAVAYAGNPQHYGTRHDPMIGRRIGGINVFGGGLALYADDQELLGGLGVSGDTSCSDHIIAWKLRHRLNLDDVPNGPADETDNIIYDTEEPLEGFEHPLCFDAEGRGNHRTIGESLPENFPTGSQP